MRRALVVGAGGAVGEAACAALLARGWAVDARMRTDRADAAERLRAQGAAVSALDLEDDISDACAGADLAVFAPILTLSAPAALRAAVRPARMIFFSSNNVSVDGDAPVYRALAEAERALREQAPNAVILRPTLIYGDPRLRAIPRVMAMMGRLPFFAMPGDGRALQQPVHCRDLGALVGALADDATHDGKTFAVGGMETLSMRSFYQAILDSLDRQSLLLPTPPFALRVGRRLLGSRFPLDEHQIARANRDRCAPRELAPPFAPRVPLHEGLRALARALGHVRSNT